MNFCINRLDNIKIERRSYEIISSQKVKDLKMDGAIVGADAEYADCIMTPSNGPLRLTA